MVNYVLGRIIGSKETARSKNMSFEEELLVWHRLPRPQQLLTASPTERALLIGPRGSVVVEAI